METFSQINELPVVAATAGAAIRYRAVGADYSRLYASTRATPLVAFFPCTIAV
jgi:hypothetical protein